MGDADTNCVDLGIFCLDPDRSIVTPDDQLAVMLLFNGCNVKFSPDSSGQRATG